jgi:hypothetical protein
MSTAAGRGVFQKNGRFAETERADFPKFVWTKSPRTDTGMAFLQALRRAGFENDGSVAQR